MTVQITLGIANNREPDSGIASRSFDNSVLASKSPALLGVGDNAERGAVFHRTTRIHELRLAEYFAAGRLGQALEPDQRGLADMTFNSLIMRSAHSKAREANRRLL